MDSAAAEGRKDALALTGSVKSGKVEAAYGMPLWTPGLLLVRIHFLPAVGLVARRTNYSATVGDWGGCLAKVALTFLNNPISFPCIFYVNINILMLYFIIEEHIITRHVGKYNNCQICYLENNIRSVDSYLSQYN